MAAQMVAEFVTRTVGFGQEHEFVAEVTKHTLEGGLTTVREFGQTAWGALERARATARAKLHARQRQTGFYVGGFCWRTPTYGASFHLGFA